MIISCDTESTGLSIWHGDRPFAISICYENENTDYIDFEVDPKTRIVKYIRDFKERQFCSLLEDKTVEKVFHHAKHDIRMLSVMGIKVRGKIHDTSIAARCVNTLELTVKLKVLAKKYLNLDTEDEDELQKITIFYRKKAKGLGYKLHSQVAGDYWLEKLFNKAGTKCEKYCRKDSLRTMQLHKFYKQAMVEFGVTHTYEKELELLHVLYEMENKGLYTNLERIKAGQVYCENKKTEMEAEIFSRYGGPVNLDSPAQLGPYLVEKLKVPIIERTAPSRNNQNGQIATGLPILKQYFNHNPEGLTLLFKRSAYETVRGYYEGYVDHYTNGYIHPSLKQFDTKTFRLSCVDPNLQNVANPDTSGGNISYVRDDTLVNARGCFGPEPGTIWLVIDYKQLELRIFASRAEETNLIRVFLDNGDPHNETRIRCPYLAAMHPAQGRKIAKNTNFTVINVGGKDALWEKYAIPLDQGEIVVHEFKAAYPNTKKRAYACQHFAERNGYIINAYNDKIFCESGYEYRGTSYDIQSSAARLIKRAMVNLRKFFQDGGLKTHLLLQVHDELVIGVPEVEFSTALVWEIQRIMEDNGGAFCIPTPVDVSIVRTTWDKKLPYPGENYDSSRNGTKNEAAICSVT